MSTVHHLFRRLDPNDGCTNDTCSPSQSIYGYRASLPASLIFLIIFALSGALHLYQGVRTKQWFFSIAMFIGCLASALGYVAKTLLHYDPFSDVGFNLSVVVLTFAPAFFAAGIYYTLKHITLILSPTLSRLRPSLYTTLFILFDLFSIILQAAGGATASTSPNLKVLEIGDKIMITGLSVQVVTMVIFGGFALDYALAVRRATKKGELSEACAELGRKKRFRWFVAALTLSYVCILVRCAYRLAELANGWSDDNEILRNQNLFIGLDSVTCAIATLVLNIWHPGRCLSREKRDVAAKMATESGSSDEERGVVEEK
ncbi:unnamed protein product [Zymoseptoria tritici ST99CH_1E4]|uniref:RTA1-domain-containing protein n=1 Tax=Zymoseptoria tritici ST99CH_1E4 TaxID=1276532 RepID=A0A2H1GHV5_ZYMTR|nr:unnamed protein product [Zymoseptoria tritici ST99CH_1E4]